MTSILIDTHVALWLLDDSPRLGPRARALLTRADAVRLSAASTGELAIKASLGKLTLPDELPQALEAAGLLDLPVSRRHSLAATDARLPHKDPFDAILVTQARLERLTFLTADRKILDAWDEAVDARS
ncbi:type II toxin-antitoxin system VapC family toxin [Nocardioides sp. DS6]|uniref:Type II toxin-antitoxin system VapC family toxin n=1 Tax=Nocardioides eburneus TaxID=3231482 RepID=A0ABV3SWG2_9ACTN